MLKRGTRDMNRLIATYLLYLLSLLSRKSPRQVTSGIHKGVLHGRDPFTILKVMTSSIALKYDERLYLWKALQSPHIETIFYGISDRKTGSNLKGFRLDISKGDIDAK
jgi:hypothetical protein